MTGGHKPSDNHIETINGSLLTDNMRPDLHRPYEVNQMRINYD